MSTETMMFGADQAPAVSPDEAAALAMFPSMVKDASAQAGFSNPLTEDQPKHDEPRSDAEMAQAMFTNMHGGAVREIEKAAMEIDAVSPEEAKEISDSWVPHFNALQLSATESSDLVSVATSAHRTPPDETTMQQWVSDAKAGIIAEYGADNVRSLLDDAKRLINQRPGLARWLTETGLGNHPRVVAIAVAKARQARAAGKLK